MSTENQDSAAVQLIKASERDEARIFFTTAAEISD